MRGISTIIQRVVGKIESEEGKRGADYNTNMFRVTLTPKTSSFPRAHICWVCLPWLRPKYLRVLQELITSTLGVFIDNGSKMKKTALEGYRCRYGWDLFPSWKIPMA